METDPNTPYVLPRNVGVADVWFPSSPEGMGRYSTKVSARETEGRLFQMHSAEPRGAAPPVHTHQGNETLYIIGGELSIFLGDERIEAGPGDFVAVPKGAEHTWLVRSEEAEVLVTLAPAGPGAYGLEFLGPPPTL